MLLTPDNYAQGFLVDEELMGGVTEHPSRPGIFAAFVLRHTTGEYLGYEYYPSLEVALEMINQVQRDWTFDQTSGCGNGNCGKNGQQGGQCKGGGCKAFKPVLDNTDIKASDS